MVGVVRHVQRSKNNKFPISLLYFKNEVRDKYDFLHEVKHQRFLQGECVILLLIARYAQNTQNSKFVMPLWYLKKEGRDEVDFLYADKHRTLLQVDCIKLDGHGQVCTNYPK